MPGFRDREAVALGGAVSRVAVRAPAGGTARSAMGRLAGGIAIGLLILGIGPAPAAPAERIQRYSGRVERVELVEGLVVVDEMGAKGHRHKHELYVSADTPIVTAGRLAWAAAFQEVRVSLVDLITGDFVVVESTEADGRMVALRIVIIEGARRARP